VRVLAEKLASIGGFGAVTTRKRYVSPRLRMRLGSCEAGRQITTEERMFQVFAVGLSTYAAGIRL
jgi:hypothetical protein